MAAPVTTRPLREINGSAPGAASSALAVRTWRRHSLLSKVAGAAGVRPPAPVRIRNSRYCHARPPARTPSGTAGGAAATAAAARCPWAASCHDASQARYGAAATRSHNGPGPTPAGSAPAGGAPARPTALAAPAIPATPADRMAAPAAATADPAARTGQAATAASHAAVIGRHQAAVAYSRRGGQPRHHPAAAAAAAASVTGASAAATAASAASPSSRQSPRASACRTGCRAYRSRSRLTARTPATRPNVLDGTSTT